MSKIKVTSMTDGQVGVYLPELHFSRTWIAKGASIEIEKDVLLEAIYDQGFYYMITHGILWIDDMAFKREVGLEPEEATEPVNIIKLTDADMKMYWTSLNLAKFKEKVQSMNKEQIQSMFSFAVKNKYTDYDKCAYLKSISGLDVLQTVRLTAQNDEPAGESKK